MSLERYYNKQKLLDLNNYQYGQLFTTVDLDLLNSSVLSPHDPKLIDNNIVEVHLLSLEGDYLGQDDNAAYVVVDEVSNSLLINIREVFNISGIDRGAYNVVLNMIRPLIGGPNESVLFIKEIGSGAKARDEIRLDLIPNATNNQIANLIFFAQAINQLIAEDVLNHVVVNFGFNRIIKVRNIKFDLETNSIFIKAYDSLADDINEKDTGWIGFEIIDPYIDTLVLTSPVIVSDFNKLRGPNFDIDADVGNSKSTILKSFNDLLDSDTTTNQRVINMYLSGSNSVTLNIDYSDYANFVFYGGAQERIENFKYKLELSEYYDEQIGIIRGASGSSAISAATSSKVIYQKRKDNVLSNFSDFENWLYYAPTASIFTHGITGSLTPWPKYISGSKQFIHHTTHSLSTAWYTEAAASASAYDAQNWNRLSTLTPEHIVRDDNNSQYIVFMDMIGEHFDSLYGYVRGLTSIYERDEHPDRGAPNELLPAIAESMGWHVQNTKDTSDLWLYAAGANTSGSLVDTGSLASLPHRSLNYQVWKRIVNNMPYLLKTKGTARSVRALLSIYGIPHTLISIKEYGGAPKETFKPALVDDHFSYKLNFDGKQHVDLVRTTITTASLRTKNTSPPFAPPRTTEFRFSTNYSSSVSMSLWSLEKSGTRNTVNGNLEVVHANSTTTGSYSGSYDWGYMRWSWFDNSSTLYTVSSSYIPIFDNDIWNVRINTNNSFVTNTGLSGSIIIDVQKSSDCVDGQIVHSASMTGTIVTSSMETQWGFGSTLVFGIIGGSTGSAGAGTISNNTHRFSGSIQAYKEYSELITDGTFDSHTLNPAAYHGNNPTSSFYELYRYFPMGMDGIRHDHTVKINITSSQPDRNIIFYNSASFEGFTGTQATQYSSFREQHYVYTPTIGGDNIINDKIRLEGNKLMWDLSPEARAEKSRYDFAPIDTNRLAIVFSPTDQVNREIFNHTGYVELDDYIGDPGDQFEYEYKDLRKFSEEYWKKYSRKYNINEFIKIFSIYDYTIFEQIRQLIPARADLIDGVLIEPHILERPKVVQRRPSYEILNWDGSLSVLQNKESGQYATYTSSIATSGSVESEYSYYTSSFAPTSSLDGEYCYYTASLAMSASITGSHCYYTSSAIMYDVYSGSIGETGSVVDNCATRCDYKRVIYHYSSSNTFYKTHYLRQFAVFVSMSYGWHYSRSLVDACYQIEECSPYNRARFVGSTLSGADFNIDSTETVDGGPVVWFQESDPNRIIISGDSSQGNLKVE